MRIYPYIVIPDIRTTPTIRTWAPISEKKKAVERRAIPMPKTSPPPTPRLRIFVAAFALHTLGLALWRCLVVRTPLLSFFLL